MRSLVIYYTHSGNTAYAARRFFDALRKHGDTDLFELKYIGGESLLTKFFYRFAPSLVKLATVPVDLKEYDVLCLGISVLGAFPSAAMSKYISMCENINGKKVICFYIFGFEISAENCARYVERLLIKRGNPQIIDVYIPWHNVLKEDFLDKIIASTIAKVISPQGK
jgi:hypothetical protein